MHLVGRDHADLLRAMRALDPGGTGRAGAVSRFHRQLPALGLSGASTLLSSLFSSAILFTQLETRGL